MRVRSLFRVVPIAALLMALAPGRAEAHAVLLEAVPTPGSTVAGPDVSFALRYNARIDHERSSVMLIAPDGSEKKITLVTEGVRPEAMRGKLTKLLPGKYRLRWQVLAVDGHITRGDVEFSVRAP